MKTPIVSKRSIVLENEPLLPIYDNKEGHIQIAQARSEFGMSDAWWK
ncbi:hypothetical protein [Chitinophaga sp. 212800010-3]